MLTIANAYNANKKWDEKSKQDAANRKNSMLIPGASNGGTRVDLMCHTWDSPTFDGRRPSAPEPKTEPLYPKAPEVKTVQMAPSYKLAG